MYGVIFGDIAGCLHEGDQPGDEKVVLNEQGLPARNAHVTDDSVCTLAIAQALLDCRREGKLFDMEAVTAQTTARLREFGNAVSWAGYGHAFSVWLRDPNKGPYQSYGNGAPMRVSACAYFAKDEEHCKALAAAVTRPTHDHPEGMKAAECEALMIYHALHGATKEALEALAKSYYDIDFDFYAEKEKRKMPTLSNPPRFKLFDCTSQGCMPVAIRAFLDSDSYIDCICKLVAWGGDADTLAAIGGGIAGAYYGVDDYIIPFVENDLLEDCQNIDFELLPTLAQCLAYITR